LCNGVLLSISSRTLRRSARADVAPKHQQLPQYCGKCWFRDAVKYETPPTFPQLNESGRWEESSHVWGKGLVYEL
jgi:hypothetical protein